MTMFDFIYGKMPEYFDEKAILYHYTSVDVLNKFLEDDGDLYCTHFGALNDSSEMMIGLSIAESYLRKRFKKPSITYDELKVVFPDKLRGVRNSQWGCFVKKIEAERLRKASGYSRHFLDDDIIRIGDGEIAVSSQWGIGNIKPFVERAKKLKFEIKRVK